MIGDFSKFYLDYVLFLIKSEVMYVIVYLIYFVCFFIELFRKDIVIYISMNYIKSIRLKGYLFDN